MPNEFVIHLINTQGNDFLLSRAMFLNLVYTTLQNMKEENNKSLRKPNDCLFSTWVKNVFILFVYYGKSVQDWDEH